jgi:PAS domain S-box-containing protein
MWKTLVKEFITNDYKRVVQAVLDQAFQEEETSNFEFPLMIEVSVHLYALLYAMTGCDEQGNISGVVSIGQDITGRLGQEQEYSHLIDTVNALIFGVDILGCIKLWNKSASRLIGYGTEAVMGCFPLSRNSSPTISKLLCKLCLSKRWKGVRIEFPLFTKRGTHIELLLNATTRQDEQGNMFGVVGIGQDITARSLQEVEYSKLINTANASILGINTVGRVNVGFNV